MAQADRARGRRWGFGEKLRVRGFTNTAAGMPTTALADEILLEGEGQVRALINLGGNPVAAWPDQLKTIAAMKKLELLVQIDIKMSATAKLAHYVIAPRLSLEMPGITLNQDYLALYGVGFGYPEAYGQYTPAIAEPPRGRGRHRGVGVLLRDRAAHGPSARSCARWASSARRRASRCRSTWSTSRRATSIFAILMRDARISFEELKRHPHGAVFPDPPVFVAPKQAGLAGPPRGRSGRDDGRARAARGAAPRRASPRDYPARLISRRMMTAYNSSARDLPALRAKWPYNPAFMHPAELRAAASRPAT